MAKFCIIIPDEEIDEETKDALRSAFAAHEECNWCGGIHQGMCPRVKKIVYHPTDDRQIREVEFWADGEWSRSNVVMPEDVVLWDGIKTIHMSGNYVLTSRGLLTVSCFVLCAVSVVKLGGRNHLCSRFQQVSIAKAHCGAMLARQVVCGRDPGLYGMSG